MMLFFVALFLWFAVSIPVALLIGRMLRLASAESRVPLQRRPVHAHPRGVVRS